MEDSTAGASSASGGGGGGRRRGSIGTLRRAFCLLVLFDLIFTCTLWIFYTRLLNQQDLAEAFRDQVLRYQFQSSVFDLVFLSFARFLLLEIFYALLRIANPWVVAVTTALSTVFIVVKIILYDYNGGEHGHSVFDYLLPIVSLILVWSETFLLDCKVLPVERAEQLSHEQDERSPLLPGAAGYGHYPGVYGGGFRHSVVPSEGFVTPDSTPEHSDDEEVNNGHAAVNIGHLSVPNHEERQRFSQRALRLADEAWQCLTDLDWRCVHDRAPLRILSQKSRHRSSGKAWRLEALIGLSAERLFQEIWDRVDRQAEWNPTVQFSRLVARPDADTAIVHNATADAAGGLIKSRDFVSLCVRRQRDGVLYSGGVSVETALVPRSERHTRGENFPGCVACVPLGTDACKLVWTVDSDIKGWVPARVIDQAMCSVMLQLGAGIQHHASRIAEKERAAPSLSGLPVVGEAQVA